MELTDTSALVTGGSSGIGFAIARKIIEEGGEAVIAARNEDRLNRAAEEIGAVPIQADVSRESDVEHMVQQAADTLDGYNTLINNAGQGLFARLENLDAEEFRRILNINTVGAMMAAQASVPHFKRQSCSNIINISSTAGKKGFEGGTAYCASKFAMGAMTECWRAELRQHNVRVMQINPSEVQTKFGNSNGDGAGDINPTKLVASDIADTAVAMISMENRGFLTETSVWATNPR